MCRLLMIVWAVLSSVLSVGALDTLQVTQLPESGWTLYAGVPRLFASAEHFSAIENDMWFGTYEDGAVRFDGRSWVRYSGSDGIIDGAVSTILRAKDGSLWVAGRHQGKSAAARFDGKAWRIFTEADGLVGDAIHVGFADDKGDLWFGTWESDPWEKHQSSGLMRFDGETWRVYTTEDGLAHNQVYSIAQTTDGALWFATFGGLSRFDGKVWTSYNPAEGQSKLDQQICTVEAAQDGSLWMGFGRHTKGVVRYDGHAWNRYTSADGLGHDAVHSIFQSRDGIVWFGTDAGLTRFDGEVWHTYDWEQIQTTFDVIHCIVEAADGALWMEAATRHEDLVLRLMPDRQAPETALESGAEQVSWRENFLLTWSGKDNNTPQDRMRYQWRLDSGMWIPLSKRTDQMLSSLSLGRHRFEVRAVDQDGNVDPTPAVRLFIVDAPLWQVPWVFGQTIWQAPFIRWSAILFLGLVVGGGCWGGWRVRQERQLSRLKTEFVSNVSHELKTPLTSIRMFVETLRLKRYRDESEAEECLKIMQQEIERLTRMVDRVLDLSRMERGKKQFEFAEWDLTAVIQETTEVFERQMRGEEEACEVHTEIAPDLPLLMFDRDTIAEVLQNLLHNAVKYSQPPRQVWVRLKQENGSAKLEVGDNGIGISKRDQKRIFDRFYRVDDTLTSEVQGSGLGLAMVKYIVEAHDGNVTLESQVGKGSQFTVHLPVRRD
ncbi:MAG: ATP-binding protein [bacterium]|nr:ATP-binding protein [bacterium]